MKVTSPPTAGHRPRRVAIGEFDGVHRGHVEVIGDADTVLTFEPHPRAVIGPTGAPDLLTTLDQKCDLIAALGVEELVVAEFNIPFSRMSAEQFVDEVIVGALSATEVRVGANFRFGSGATGTSETLLADTRFETFVSDLVEHEGWPVSSSAIRDLIRGGDIELAAAMLGHPFVMRGVVIEGAQRGRELGYPTANVVPSPGCVLPKQGVYAARVGDRIAAANLGIRPMFEDDDAVLLETHLLDFEGDLYGQEIDVELVAFLRPEERFDSVKALEVQMAEDCRRARELAAAHDA